MSEEEGYTGTNVDLGSFEDKIQKVANEIEQKVMAQINPQPQKKEEAKTGNKKAALSVKDH